MTRLQPSHTRVQAPAGPKRTAYVLGGLLLVLGLAFLNRDNHFSTFLGLLFIAGLAARGASWLGRNDRGLQSVLLVALAARLGFMVLDHTFALVPKLDAGGYHMMATDMADRWARGDWTGIEGSPGVRAYATFVAVIYYVFGSTDVLARSASAALGMAATACVFGITRHLFGRAAAIGASATYAVLPTAVMLQSEELRDPLVHAIILGLMWLLVTSGLGRPRVWPLYALGAFYLFHLRVETFFVVLVPFVIVFIVAFSRSSIAHRLVLPRRVGRPAWLRGTRFIPLALLSAGVMAGAWLVNRVTLPYQGLVTPEGLSHRRFLLGEGGSAYLTHVRFPTWGHVLVFLPVGAFYFLFTPFPSQVHNKLAFAAFLENLFLYYPLVFVSLRNMVWRRLDWSRVALLGFLLVGALFYGLVEANVGTALRHRAQFTWVFLVFAGPFLGQRLVPLLRRLRDRAHALGVRGIRRSSRERSLRSTSLEGGERVLP